MIVLRILKLVFKKKVHVQVVVSLDITAADNVAIDNLIRSMNMKVAPRKICWILCEIVEQRTSCIGLSQGYGFNKALGNFAEQNESVAYVIYDSTKISL